MHRHQFGLGYSDRLRVVHATVAIAELAAAVGRTEVPFEIVGTQQSIEFVEKLVKVVAQRLFRVVEVKIPR